MRRIVKLAALTGVLGCAATAALTTPFARAGEPAPSWTIYARAEPTDFSAAANNLPSEIGDGYSLVVRNSGSKATDGSPVSISDTLQSGISPIKVEAWDIGPGFVTVGGTINEPKPVILGCELHLHSVACVDEQIVQPGDLIYVSIEVHVSPGLAEGERAASKATVAGGGASTASASLSTAVSSSPASFDIEDMSMQVAGSNGLTDTQAGDHPYEFTTTFTLNTAVRHTVGGEFPYIRSVEDPKDIVVDLPPGLLGNPQAVQKCSQSDAQAATRFLCPAGSQVGVARLNIQGLNHYIGHEIDIVPIYNVVPEQGTPAQFMFAEGPAASSISAAVGPDTGYAVRTIVSGIPRIAELTAASVTLFGEPLKNHDIYNKSAGAAPLAFLQNPVDCAAGPLRGSVSVDSWEHPGSWLPDGSPNLADPNWKTVSTVVYPSLTGCDGLHFNPSISLAPETTRADEPLGLGVNVHLPQGPGAAPALVTPQLKDATVTLPSGVSLSPSAADGLRACTDAEVGLESPEPDSCPDASVLGSAKVLTPLLEAPLTGRVYLGPPNCAPCTAADAADGRMLRVFLVAQGSGVRIKKEGTVYLDPASGQVMTRFEDNPQAPFEDLELHLKGGLRASLATPQSCGTFATSSDFVPWSTPATPDSNPIFPFAVSWDGSGSACPALAPLTPSFSAGTTRPSAAQFSPFTMSFGREDREQDLSAVQLYMPPGLIGKLTGVAECPQAAIEASERKSGAEEERSPSCPASSEVGSVDVAAGPGQHPFHEQGRIYLTGSYKGAPLGLAIIVPALAGPFDLGNVVVRSRIDVDQQTAALTVTSDPFPQVIDGIPLRLRQANVTVGRPGFVLNPSNCKQKQIAATIAGAQGAQAQVSVPFAVSGCAALPFNPKLSLALNGKTTRGAHPSLRAVLRMPKASQANIARAQVTLPHAEFLDNAHIKNVCTRAQFAASGCPASSVLGHAQASTPLLDHPLEGPVYLMAGFGHKLPDVAADLNGQIRVLLHGKVDTGRNGGIRNTFEVVPDAPVTKFVMSLKGGSRGLLVNSENLCSKPQHAIAAFTAQNGKLSDTEPLLQIKCRQAHRKRHHRR